MTALWSYIARRILLMVPTLIGIVTITFIIIQFVPGGPVEQIQARFAGQALDATATISGSVDTGASSGIAPTGELDPEMVKELEKLYGFDKPVLYRYFKMLGDFARFEFGNSYYKDRPVVDLIIEKLPVSISLGLWTTLITYLVAIPLGIRKAMRSGTAFDAWTSFFVTIGYAIPGFLFAMLIVIAGFPAAFVSVLFTSSLLIEVIFSLDGLGLLGFEATLNRDYPVMLGSLFIFSLLGLLTNLLGDITYVLVDPRIDFERRDV